MSATEESGPGSDAEPEQLAPDAQSSPEATPEPTPEPTEEPESKELAPNDDVKDDVVSAASFKTSEDDNESVSETGTVHERSDSQVMAFQMGGDGFSNGAESHSNSHSINRRKSSLAEMQQMMLAHEQGQPMMGGSVMSEYEEIAQVNDDKQYFSELFDKIDLEKNGDVDRQEFKMGLERIGVYLNEEQVQKLFVLLDADASGYIDRAEWVNFLMQPFQNPGLRELQDTILGHVRRHSRSGSNLVRPTDMGDLTATEMNRMRSEMSHHMSQLVTTEIQKVQEEESFFQEIEDAATDPNFCKPENAGNWDIREVVYWLDSLKFGEYIRAFTEEGIDGGILLQDVTRDLLEQILAVKPVHVSKMLREIDRIRDQNQIDIGPSVSYKDLEQENEQLKLDLQEAQAIIKEQEEKLNSIPPPMANPMAAMMMGGSQGDGLGSAQNSGARGAMEQMGMMNPMMMMQMQMMEMNQKLMNKVIGDDGESGQKRKKLDDDDDSEQKALELDGVEEIERLRAEIDSLRQSKIQLAVQTQDEIANLREIVKLLSDSLERETAGSEETPGGFAALFGMFGLSNGQDEDSDSDYDDRDDRHGRGRKDKRDRRDRDRRDRSRDRRDDSRDRGRRDDRDHDRDRDRDRH